MLDCKGGMEAAQAARWASQAWQLELATMDVLPPYALASVARDVLLTWVIQKGRVQDMDLQQQECIDSGVPCQKYLGHPGVAIVWAVWNLGMGYHRGHSSCNSTHPLMKLVHGCSDLSHKASATQPPCNHQDPLAAQPTATCQRPSQAATA